jgi:hypothetical protein
MCCTLGMSGCATSKFTDEPGYPFAPIISRLVDKEGYPFFGRTPLEDAKQAYALGDYLKAFNLYMTLAEQGNAEAQYELGKMYQNTGLIMPGVASNIAEGDKWISRSQITENPVSMASAMAAFDRGDYKNAFLLFNVLARKGDADAQQLVGYMYQVGFGVTQNDQEAQRWIHLSVENKNLKTLGVSQTQHPIRTINKPQTQAKASPPQLVFSSSLPRNDGSVELSGRVSSSANISEVSINGRTLEVPLAKDGSFKVIRGLQIGVVTTYRLSVMDDFGQRAEASVTAERAIAQYVDEVVPLNPRKMKAKINQNAIALIIGVESYSSLPPAQYADSDASHFYDYANQALGVPANKIKLLTNAKATRADLLMAMKGWMRTEIAFGWSDVYIFFAGHGLANADGSKTYLLPADGRRELLDETSILRDDLIASAKGAKTITLFLDTCYSGGTRTNELLLADARPIAIVPDRSALPLNVTVLAAASGAQLSSIYEAAQQGLFSYWLMKGLEGGADINRDRKITTGELHQYASKNVGPIAQRRNREQNPQLMGDSTRVLVNY